MNHGTSTTHRLWATLSLISAVLWIIFSTVLPTPVTTLMGLPFAGVALVGGWLSRRQSLRLADKPAARRAAWGVGLSCAGCLWQAIYLTFWGALLVGGAGSLLRYYFQGTPAP
ncbi:MAG TPA: hypothetical protein VI793_09800 [Anaerolineales bacterium]|nr:hypothetical protein [Anaerolineales bacterium]